MKFLCGKCNYYFESMEALAIHVHEKHPEMNSIGRLMH